jgi:hypothetical protein
MPKSTGCGPSWRSSREVQDEAARLELIVHDGCPDFEVSDEPCRTPYDGRPDQGRRLRYDEDSRLLSEWWDLYADGEFDVVTHFTYDEHGRRLSEATDYGLRASLLLPPNTWPSASVETLYEYECVSQ